MNRTRPYRPSPVGSVWNRTGPYAEILKSSKPFHSFLQPKPQPQAQTAPAQNHCLEPCVAEGVQKSFLRPVWFGFKPNLPCLGPSGSVSNRTYRVWGPKVIFPNIDTYGRSAGCSGSSARAHRKKGIFNFSRICYTQYIQFWVTGRSVPLGPSATLPLS